MKNWYCSYHRKNGAWPLTNFSEFPEFKADPVFLKLHQIYKRIFKIDRFVNLGGIEHPLYSVHLSLCSLATKMANRDMKEEEYLSLLEGRHPIIEEVNSLVDKVFA